MTAPILPPAVQQNVQIVNPDTGFMTAYFSIWLIQILNAIINQTNSNTSVIAALNAQQQQILAVIQQLTALQQNQSGGNAGAANALVNVSGATWVNGPQVNLTGVVAGNLIYPGSGPNQVNTTDVNQTSGVMGTFTGAWRLVEIVGAVETTVVTGAYTAQRLRDDTGVVSILYNTTDTTGSIAATSTGAVSYRLDANATGFEVIQMQLAIYVDRT